MILDVGIFDPGAAADKSAAFKLVGRAFARPQQQPLRAHHRLAEKVCLAIQRDRLSAGHLKIAFKMVLQICADTRTVSDQLDTVLTQLLCRTNARNLEQLYGIDRTTGQNDFAGCANLMPLAAAFIFNANRTLPFKKDARCQRFFDDAQIGPRVVISIRPKPSCRNPL